MLWWDTGTGKTYAGANYVFVRFLNKEVTRVLVVCPLAAVGVWERDTLDYKPSTIPLHLVSQNQWSNLSRLPGVVNELWKSSVSGKLSFLIVTYGAVSRHIKALKHYNPDLVIFDESHYIKNYKSMRTKRALALARGASYVLCLSGTPAPNGHIDLYWQVKAVHPLILPPTIGEFKERYCDVDYWGNVTGYKNEAELAERLSRVVLRAEKSLLKLPPVIDQTVPVKLDPKTESAYRQLRRNLVLSLSKDRNIEAPHHLTLAVRLAQLTGGWIDGDPVGEQAKLQYLLGLVESLPGQKIVIWCRFLAEIEGISKALREQDKTCASLTGATTGRMRDEIIDSFQNRPDPQILICQSAALGVAVSFTAASTAIFYSLDWDAEKYEQARGRTHRPGQQHTCHYLHLIAKGTIDETIYDALKRKMNRQQVLGAIVEELVGVHDARPA